MNTNSEKTLKKPTLFNEFFELGQQETVSPFLTASSRAWGADLTLKAAFIAAFLLAAAFTLSFFPHTLPLSHLLLVFVYFLAGIPALIESIEDLTAFEINIDILMTLAAFSSVMIGSAMEGALLLVLFAVSGSMEDAVTSKAKRAISSLHKLAPSKAFVIEDDGSVLEKSVKDISVGTKILVKAGEIVPLDGKVISGASSVNLVHLTGENMPVTKITGDTVPSGGHNLEGALTLEVENNSANSTIAKIVQLVTQAQEAKPSLQRWFDKLSQSYAMAIIALFVLFSTFLPFFIDIPYLGTDGSLYRGLTFLIAASPCALIIAIPIAYLSAISSCASHGILLKGGIALDALASCKAIAFDKTGTLTFGDLEVVGVDIINNSSSIDENTMLSIANALETNAVHPIAKAITLYCAERKNLSKIALENFKSIPGYGLQAEVKLSKSTSSVYIGNPEYVLQNFKEESVDALNKGIRSIKNHGELVALLSIDTNLFLFRFKDVVRPLIKDTITAVKKRGLRLIMLTGDDKNNASQIAKDVGIDEFHANLKPEDKLQAITNLSKQSKFAMIGDGVNDAPALARATVGICMGKVGSTSAIEAADIVLLHDNIEMLDWLLAKAYKTQNVVKQNVLLASLAIVVASFPALAGIIPLWLAVILHEGGTILVGLNALRLLR